MKIHRSIKVKGSVQGVYFRVSTMNMAASLGLTGYVKNVEDGSVFIEAEGQEQDVTELINWCKHGPAGAEVDEVEVLDEPVANFDDFHIRYDS